MSSVAEALRGLKIAPKEIASRTKLAPARIQELLQGSRAALPELRAISAGLRVPMHVLAKGRRPSEDGAIEPLFRTVRGAHEDFDVTVERIAAFVEAALELLPTRTDLPAWLHGLDVREVSYPEADRLSKRFRELVLARPDDDPIFELPSVLGGLEGVIVSRLLYSRYEGVSFIAGNYCFIFVSPRFQGRMLFTIGHELGHIIAHHKYGAEARFERPSQIGTFGDNSRGEAFVDAFSSCLLLPDEGVAKALRSFRQHYGIAGANLSDKELLLLARFYGVSFEVAARRCEDLGLLPKGMGYAISGLLKKQFGSPEKRADQLEIPPRRAVNIAPVSAGLANAISKAVTSGKASIGWVTDRLGLSVGEVIAANAGISSS